MLPCTKCLTDKPDEEFCKASNAPQRRFRYYWCKDCRHQQYLDNLERHKLQCRAGAVRRRYGLTLAEYDSLMLLGCSICGETEKRVVLDHCHTSGKVRAPLCDQCNQMLGNGREQPALLRAGAEYLERHSRA